MEIKDFAKPLPSYLVQRYKGWHATTYSENESWFAHLAEHGQNPRAMSVTCCDSRLNVTSIFGVDSGEIFIHRNIANMVPPFENDDGLHGTSAAIEYAVQVLKVTNLLVIGHSQCGGVEGAYRICHEKEALNMNFIEPWLELLRPSYEAIQDQKIEREEALRAMEKSSVMVSLNNLLTFPFVEEAVKEKRLALHGLWHNIGAGVMEQFNPDTGNFEAL